jgi:hypothetical protein
LETNVEKENKDQSKYMLDRREQSSFFLGGGGLATKNLPDFYLVHNLTSKNSGGDIIYKTNFSFFQMF